MKNKNILLVVFFYIAYTLLLLSVFASSIGSFGKISNLFEIVSLALAGVVAVFSMKRKSILNMLLVIILCMAAIYLQFILEKNASLVQLILFALAAKNMNRNKLIKLDLIIKLSLLACAFIGQRIGLISSHEISVDGQGRIRNALGFTHPNFTGNLFLSIFLDILYFLNQKDVRKYKILIYGSLFYAVVCFLVDARASAMGIVIATLLSILPINKAVKTNIMQNAVALIVVVVPLALSLVLMCLPTSPLMHELDSLFSGRIRLFKAFYRHYGIGLFGNYFANYGVIGRGSYNFVLDNSYLYLLIHDGIIITFMFLYFYFIKVKKALNEKNSAFASALISHAFVAIMARSLMSITSNQFIIAPITKGKEKE